LRSRWGECDRCDILECGSTGGVCGIAQHEVLNMTGCTYCGGVWLTWDGKVRVLDAAQGCMKEQTAQPGACHAEFCFGWQTSTSSLGVDVINPHCHVLPFTYPTDEVIYDADFGG
jgi:hypothetical protein